MSNASTTTPSDKKQENNGGGGWKGFVEFIPTLIVLVVSGLAIYWVWTQSNVLLDANPPEEFISVATAPVWIVVSGLLIALIAHYLAKNAKYAKNQGIKDFSAEAWRAAGTGLFLTCMFYGVWTSMTNKDHLYFPKTSFAVADFMGETEAFKALFELNPQGHWRPIPTPATPPPQTTPPTKTPPLVMTPAAMSSVMTLIFGITMSLFSLFESHTKRKKALRDISDETYFLGFILTLFGLAFALKGYDKGSDTSLTEAIAKCGSAIGSTAVAILLRVILRRASDANDEKDKAKTDKTGGGGDDSNGGGGSNSGGGSNGGGGGTTPSTIHITLPQLKIHPPSVTVNLASPSPAVPPLGPSGGTVKSSSFRWFVLVFCRYLRQRAAVRAALPLRPPTARWGIGRYLWRRFLEARARSRHRPIPIQSQSTEVRPTIVALEEVLPPISFQTGIYGRSPPSDRRSELILSEDILIRVLERTVGRYFHHPRG